MSNINIIQNKIMELDGGEFQKLFDEYLYKRNGFSNIQTLGVQTGTNKPTKGTPDSYVLTPEGKYILINYGSVTSQSSKKIKSDILSCFNSSKLSLDKNKIKKIICGHCSTNLHIEQFEDIKNCINGVEIELIGIDTLSHDLALRYPYIAKDLLGISIDTNQFFEVEDFIKLYDSSGINAPLNYKFLYRSQEVASICESIEKNAVTFLFGPSGIGKTRLALEICRKYDKKMNVYCIRSNGNLLYEDIKYYIDSPGEYLIYLDDANMVSSLENVVSTLFSLGSEYKIKILISVRDYAKDRVFKIFSSFTNPELILIKKLKDNELKDILKTNLEIKNQQYLDKITEIANGNIRLAILAGVRAIDKGYLAIRNAEDIFSNYYEKIINDSKLNKEDILILFIITFAGPVMYNKNQLYVDLKEKYAKTANEGNIIDKLYSLELIDLFKNEIIKISDQSLGNYILYYVLLKKKWIKIDELISISFPKYKQKTVYALQTLQEIFYSNDSFQYIKESIINAWDKAPNTEEMEYLESFFQINPEKALYTIKKHIDNEQKSNFNLQNFDIEKHKNFNSIKTKEIEILGGYKYTDNFEDTIELILLYYSKRPDLVMDFYFVICNSLFDKYSYENNYKAEITLINKLWESTNNGNNYENSILYLYIAEYALKTEITYTEKIRNRNAYNLVTMYINYNKEIETLRHMIWKTLGVLRNNNDYRSKVNKILLENHFNGLDNINSVSYLQSDFNAINLYIINKNNLSFIDAMIFDKYKKYANEINAPQDERYSLSINNSEFRIYEILNYEDIYKFKEKNDKVLLIYKEISAYSLSDFKNMFKICNFLEKNISLHDHWSMMNGLEIMFNLLENNEKLYIDVITEYLNANTPFKLNGYQQVKKLLEYIGYEKTYKLLNTKDYPSKNIWLSLIWECISEKNITESITNDFKIFIINNLEKTNPIIPNIHMLSIYGKKDTELKTKVIKKLVSIPKLSYNFLENVFYDKEIDTIIDVFKDDIDALLKVYINAIKINNKIDYNGTLFKKIFIIKPIIWNEYIDIIKKDPFSNDYKQNVIEIIWNCDQWKECIDYAFKKLFNNSIMYFSVKTPAELLFNKTMNYDNMLRKKKWLLNKLHTNIDNIKLCKILIDIVITVMPDWKKEFILEFVNMNKKIDDFKKINLFPLYNSWSGSQIPLILNKIDFLKTIKDSLNGIDFLEHKKYLEDYCRRLVKYKKQVELQEYLENEDYS